jgi:hypothetical protein
MRGGKSAMQMVPDGLFLIDFQTSQTHLSKFSYWLRHIMGK